MRGERGGRMGEENRNGGQKKKKKLRRGVRERCQDGVKWAVMLLCARTHTYTCLYYYNILIHTNTPLCWFRSLSHSHTHTHTHTHTHKYTQSFPPLRPSVSSGSVALWR